LKKTLFIGHSHTVAIQSAARELVELNPCESPFDFIDFRSKEFAPNYIKAKPMHINPQFQTAFNGKVSGVSSVVSCAHGNEYSILGLVNSTRPFDFFLSEENSPEVCNTVELIPEQFVVERLTGMAFKIKFFLTSLRELTPKEIPLFHMESPPPNPDLDHINKFPGAYAQRIKDSGIAPNYLRYKIWRVYSGIVRSHCEKIGITFISAPKGGLDDNGFLGEGFRENDPTHGNARYGKLVLEETLDAIKNLDKT